MVGDEEADKEIGPEEAAGSGNDQGAGTDTDELEIAARDRFRPCTMGLSFHARLPPGSRLKVILPEKVRLAWQQPGGSFPVNGWYRKLRLRCAVSKEEKIEEFQATGHARYPAAPGGLSIRCDQTELQDSRCLTKAVVLPQIEGVPVCPLKLDFRVYPRKTQGDDWLITVILRNRRDERLPSADLLLYQVHFEVEVEGAEASFLTYPESQVQFEELTPEEQNLELLYREQPTWGTGHGCAAAWDDLGATGAPGTLRRDHARRPDA